LIGSTLTDVTEKEDVTYACLLSVLDRWVATSVNWEDLPPCPTLGIDEIALLKGHRDYLAVISARDQSGMLHLLAILPDRLKTTIVAWLKALPDAVRERITTVCTDMWEGYVNAVEEVLPSAQIVIESTASTLLATIVRQSTACASKRSNGSSMSFPNSSTTTSSI